jgi:hypothetical protein
MISSGPGTYQSRPTIVKQSTAATGSPRREPPAREARPWEAMREHDGCQGDQAEGDRDDPELHRVELVAGPFGDLVADCPLSDPGENPKDAQATPAGFA